MDDPRIVRLEWGMLEGRRPRHAGRNARLGDHGVIVRVPMARLTAEDGSSGFGRCRAQQAEAQGLLGARLSALFSLEQGALDASLAFDLPLWDLVGKRAGQPVYRLAAALNGHAVEEPLRVPCYDTSLYFDDLHLDSTQEAARLIAHEARQGYARGHRAFKVKVGRGARHLPLEEGTARDVAVVQAVREAVGPACTVMVDANNGYNLNLAKRVLAETADCQLFWLEEAFHEDRVLYQDLKEWMQARGLAVLIADGEGEASPSLLEWAREGVVDVVQYDIFGYGFTRWLALGRRLDAWDVRAAPHHYGGHIGNYVACHLAGAIQNFAYVEWDEATTPGLDAPGYAVQDGFVHAPAAPGFGLYLDEDMFRQAAAENGFIVEI